MGVETSANSEIVRSYADATHKLFKLYFLRIQKFWLHFPLIYHFSSLNKQENKLGAIVRGITHQVNICFNFNKYLFVFRPLLFLFHIF